MIEQLQQTALFAGIPLRALGDISCFCQPLALSAGDQLIAENAQHTHDLFILCDGQVEILSSGANAGSGSTSSEVVLSAQDQTVFGEISWLAKRKRTATVRCVGNVEAIRIDGQALFEYLQNHTEIGFQVMHRIALLLAERLERTDQLLKQILWNSYI